MSKTPGLVLAFLALTVMTGYGGGCVEYDVEVVTPAGGRIEDSRVVIFNTRTWEKVVMPWPEFARLESIDDAPIR